MHTERRAEKRHVIPKLWATVGSEKVRCQVDDIGRANARLKKISGLQAGELHRITIHIPIYADHAVAVPVRGTVTRVAVDHIAISYDPPSPSWARIIEALSGPRWP